jgi:hypothetical protein
MPRFCMGEGVAMGTTGLKWPSADRDADCAMLWTGLLGVSSAARSAAACVAVFLLAVLAQYLTTANASRVQEAKARAKRLLADAHNPLTRLEQGNSLYSSAGAPSQPPQQPTLERQCSSPEHECRHARREADPTPVATAENGRRDEPPIMRPLSLKRSTVSSKSKVTRPADAPLVIPKVGNWEHLVDSALHGARIFVAYLLMLAAMTYDVALLASIVAGFSVGFFWFAQDTAKVPASADPCCS